MTRHAAAVNMANKNPTKRETDCLHQVMLGWTKGEAAKHLGLSHHTVRAHLFRVCRRIGVSNLIQAAAWMAHREEEFERMKKEYQVVVSLAKLIADDAVYPNHDHLIESTMIILASTYHDDVLNKVAEIRGLIRAR